MHDRYSRPTGMTRIGDYLIERLRDHDVDTIFGVPGDFVLSLFSRLEASPLTVVNTCDEQAAGFAADAYARIRGLGAVCVTWGVGGLKIVNTTAQAFAEESPVIVISGTPSTQEYAERALLHHMVDGFDTQRRVFEQITVAQAVLDDPDTACREIDRVIDAALTHKRPVYLEIPRDLVHADAPRPNGRPAGRAHSDAATLRAAVADAVATLRTASQPVAFIGMTVARFHLLDDALALIDRTGLPTAVMPLDKSAIPEDHPRFVGVYAGQMSRPEVTRFVEEADCLLMLGTLLTDTNLGGGSANIPTERCIHVQRDRVRIGYRTYDQVRLEDFLAMLADQDLPDFGDVAIPPHPDTCDLWQPQPDTRITVRRLYERLGCFLSPQMTVVADPGDAMFAALDLQTQRDHTFFANAFYASLGFAVPASIGVQMAAPDRRPLVLVGDGAFQMTGVELSTSLRYGLSPIVVILNNGGYTTERLMIDGPFNDVLPWNYTHLVDLFGDGTAFPVETEQDLESALNAAAASDTLYILDVRLAKLDASPALRRLTERLGAAVGKGTTVN